MILIIKDYIFLIGFVTLRDDEPMHTWTGRIIRLLMSLFEFNGSVSLKSLFNNVTDIRCISDKKFEDIVFGVCGGWPSAIDLKKEDFLIVLRDYLESLIMNDVKAVDGIVRNPNGLRMVIRSLARNICTTSSLVTIKDDTFYNG